MNGPHTHHYHFCFNCLVFIFGKIRESIRFNIVLVLFTVIYIRVNYHHPSEVRVGKEREVPCSIFQESWPVSPLPQQLNFHPHPNLRSPAAQPSTPPQPLEYQDFKPDLVASHNHHNNKFKQSSPAPPWPPPQPRAPATGDESSSEFLRCAACDFHRKRSQRPTVVAAIPQSPLMC
ncbi:hypothetical protein ABFS83_05G079600 [Erythranthe nasuta]